MSETLERRSERISRYKEERRQQLAAQFGARTENIPSSVASKRIHQSNGAGSTSSSSEGPRQTRASKLRLAALNSSSSPTKLRHTPPEKSLNKSDTRTSDNHQMVERDKSRQRKSNLNRALASEEVPSPESDGSKSRRRRRRFFPPELLDQSTRGSEEERPHRHQSDSFNASWDSPPVAASASASASPTLLRSSTPKRSELSVHMENARRGVAPSLSEIGRYRLFSSQKSEKERDRSDRTSKRREGEDEDSSMKRRGQKEEEESILNRRKEEKEVTLNKKGVEKQEVSITKRRVDEQATSMKRRGKGESDLKRGDVREEDVRRREEESPLNRRGKEDESTLRKKDKDADAVFQRLELSEENLRSKRKDKGVESTSRRRDDKEPETSSRRKPKEPDSTSKRRKDAEPTARRRDDESSSSSPSPRTRKLDGANVMRRMEELSTLTRQTRAELERPRGKRTAAGGGPVSILTKDASSPQSAEVHLQGILKRRSSTRNDEEDHSLNSPQSILKRGSGASSAGSTGGTPHVSITTAVILAAAGGAEMILQPEGERVKPILKKKSFSEDSGDIPKPILKKKSSTDTDEAEEKPRPILKLPKPIETEIDDNRTLRYHSSSETEYSELKPILKRNNSREESPKPKLSFCGDGEDDDEEIARRRRRSRRSNTICADFNIGSLRISTREEDRLLRRPRPLSVHELVRSFEGSHSTGAIPKRSNLTRNGDRYRTQPVTSVELEESRNLVKSPQLREELPKAHASLSSLPKGLHSLDDFTSSLENDKNLNALFSSPLRKQPASPESFVCKKMSSDSAFQSLGDGLELEQDEETAQEAPPPPPPPPPETSKGKGKSQEQNKIESQMKAIAEEAKRLNLARVNGGIDRYRSKKAFGTERSSARFATQPVTFSELQDASRIKKGSPDSKEIEPSNMSLSDRIRLFQTTAVTPTRVRHPRARFNTEIVSPGIVTSARNHFAITAFALGDFDGEKTSQRKSILKPGPDGPRVHRDASAPKSAGKKPSKNSKADSSMDKEDEGISCNDSGSESTSEGESSGGREVQNIFKSDNKSAYRLSQKLKSKETIDNEFSHLSLDKKEVSARLASTQNEMSRTIEDLRAKLQEKGESEWKKRVPQTNNAADELKLLKQKNRYNDELSEKSLLATKKDELDTSAKSWRSRVEKSDAEKFSVAGKMSEKLRGALLTVNVPDEGGKRLPGVKKFKTKDGTESTPLSPGEGGIFDLTRSKSVPYFSESEERSVKVSSTRLEESTVTLEHLEVTRAEFDAVKRESLLVIKKNVQGHKRRRPTKNPVRALAERTDVSEDVDSREPQVARVSEKEKKTLERLAKISNMAVEALAGLASTEDFSAVALKKPTATIAHSPWKDPMLLQIKGRRHVQTRLVEPTADSVNDGDCFLLVTSNALYSYVGQYSNVIEQSRAADVANHIQKTGDLGCKVSTVLTVGDKSSSARHTSDFWKILGSDHPPEVIDAGHPAEDETYESNILRTNMIYTLEDDELVPHDKYWGSMPRIEILTETNILVFDFGSEMYVWSGKSAPLDKKKVALRLAKEIWSEGFDYTDCNVCPLNVSSVLGARERHEPPRKGDSRPDWALFAKITQHGETVLFKEKFLDWPDFSRVIQVKGDLGAKEITLSFEVEPCDVDKMSPESDKGPDLVVENTHLGRGNEYCDEGTNRLFEYKTKQLKGWHISENSYEELNEKSLGHFYDGDSYIYRWDFKQTVRGKDLNGNPSKWDPVGKDKCIYFYWQGSHSSINEKGQAAFLTIRLDTESAPQVRIEQGSEPAAFLRLFNGNMVVHKGKREKGGNGEGARLFIVQGEIQGEVHLLEVPCTIDSLRSRTSFLIVRPEEAQVMVWHGSKSSARKRKLARRLADHITEARPAELSLDELQEDDLDVVEMHEGDETEEFFDIVGTDREAYVSLVESDRSYDHTLRLYSFSSITGSFNATEVLCPHRSEQPSPYPFTQNELYSMNQPALYLLDNHYELWLWQGWWPEIDDEDNVELLSDQTGSGAVRWQAERRAAMQTAVDYWKRTRDEGEPIEAYLVWAGLEPLRFRNLFPDWEVRENITELNKKEGKKLDDMIPLEKELALLSRSTYPLAKLLQRPLPEGVDPTNIERYLSPEDFQKVLSMSKEEFYRLPSWKKTALKKEKGLF